MTSPPVPGASAPLVVNGTRLRAADGVVYLASDVVRNHSLTLRREIPKLRGKAARTADKRARRQARSQQGTP